MLAFTTEMNNSQMNPKENVELEFNITIIFNRIVVRHMCDYTICLTFCRPINVLVLICATL